MSVREDREKSSGSGVGLGVAAVAIGAGVGAALYYFLNKRTENYPNSEGSTHHWQEEPHIFRYMAYPSSEDSFTTLSEHSTMDTSTHSSDSENCSDEDSSGNHNESQSSLNSSIPNNCSSESLEVSTSNYGDSSPESSEEGTMDNTNSTSPNQSQDVTTETGYSTSPNRNENVTSESVYSSSPYTINNSEEEENMEWDVTNSSLGIPSENREREILTDFFSTIRVRLARNAGSINEQKPVRRSEVFRERTWSLEECSICFDVILKDQEVMSLPCTHHFHTGCIVPWLQEQQTCPNCRKTVD